ncbi:DUF6883 domain-containing protein [Calidithermus terrae]|uniref:DUF6883 domain-containing protein n=1 Tax=Calidithermus terrae TaxID=1408545 RepID=UPI001C3F8E2A|nr:DUF6883 domain-containing protein [Calidithermus terrae]
MYNLTVDVAHTYYVGQGQWLVHNCNITIDPRKFTDYVLNSEKSKGKHVIYEGLGYSKDDAEKLMRIYEEQALAKYKAGDYTLGVQDKYGQRISIEITIPSKGEATGKSSNLISGWMIEPDGALQLITPMGGWPK